MRMNILTVPKWKPLGQRCLAMCPASTRGKERYSSALEGGVWTPPRLGRFTPEKKKNPVSLVLCVGWALEQVWKDPGSLPPLEFKPWTVQAEMSRYTKYTIPHPIGHLLTREEKEMKLVH